MSYSHAPNGFVSLVGAGPGDPDLMTVKGLRRLKNAEVVAYDRLVNPKLLQECRAEAELIYVGKHGVQPSYSQDAINALLVEKATLGRHVVRLKGGDPFIFGRGGEEALALRAADIPFEIVPGISSAVAAPAYAGIPVTHRNVAASVAVVAGHEDPHKSKRQGDSSHDWHALAGVDTLVILMGVGRLEAITDELIKAGRSSSTPSAVVRWGTTDEQETVEGTLATIALSVREAGLKAPATLIVGEVVRLRSELRWFDVQEVVAHAKAAPEPLSAAP